MYLLVYVYKDLVLKFCLFILPSQIKKMAQISFHHQALLTTGSVSCVRSMAMRIPT